MNARWKSQFFFHLPNHLNRIIKNPSWISTSDFYSFCSQILFYVTLIDTHKIYLFYIISREIH